VEVEVFESHPVKTRVKAIPKAAKHIFSLQFSFSYFPRVTQTYVYFTIKLEEKVSLKCYFVKVK